MKVSYNWLKEFIDLPLSPEETAEKLTLIGLEVEEIEEFGSTLPGVIVGEVLEVRAHPNADRLQICEVDLGNSKTQIVCGAKNVATGQKVPVATVGAVLPIKLDDGSLLKIKKAKLRGEVSEGMICAEDELGLGSNHDGIMVLNKDLKSGTPISEIFDLYEDTVIDIAITPNRPDATCHLGVARDLAAALNLKLTKPFPSPAEKSSPSEPNGRQPQADGVVLTHINEDPIYVNKIRNLPYNPDLKDRGRELREAGNLPEVLFWNEVKSKKFHGIDFDRQRVIGSYIVDFYVKRLGLVVEIDGSSHDDKKEYDQKRDAFLEDLGLHVLHVDAHEVKKNMSGVLQSLESFIIQHYGTPRNQRADLSPLSEGNLLGNATSADISIKIENAEKCPRYVGKMVRGVEIKDSPSWLQNKLKAIGVRPVNNVVDVTNYVMYELGQPLHAFDYAAIRGKEIIVRDYEQEIEFETLDHVKRKCSPGTLFICDGEEPVAIAGVMGGVNSEVNENTTDILIESAYFDPGSIRKTAKAQTLQTDASYRFERGIDPNLQAVAAERAAQLMAEVAGGEIAEETVDVHPIKTEARRLTLRKSYTNRLLGTDFDIATIASIVEGLELKELEQNDESITFEIPTFRPDLEREVDLIEEVGRLFDYNKIPAPKHGIFVSSEPLTDWEELNQKIRSTALQLGFREIYSNSLIPEKDAAHFGELDTMIAALNPLNKDMNTLRPSLLHGFLKSASYNFNRKAGGVRFFEIGHVFNKDAEGTYYKGIREEVHLLLGVAGEKHAENWAQESKAYSVFDLKALVHAFFQKLGLLEHLSTKAVNETTLEYTWGDSLIGTIFTADEKLHEAYDFEQNAFIAELSVTAISEALRVIPPRTFKAVPKFPAFEFDFAVVVPQAVTAGEMMQVIKKKAGSQLESVDIFDVFEGESIGSGSKSLAFRLHFLDPNKTLNIKEVEPIIQKIVKSLEKDFSAKLRG
jgi:phenylalanyl-tRNA synthetase beta chain